MNKPVLLTLASLVLAGGLAGCGATPVTASNDADPAATAAPSAAAETETPTADTEEVTDDGPIAFGKTVTFEDGLEMTVGVPEKFKPSEYAAGADGDGTAMKFQVTLKNGTDKTFDPALFYATVSSNEAEAEAIFDEGLEGSPSTKLLKGKTVKFTVGYMVLNAKDITMDANPGMFEYADTIYTNNP